MAVRKPSITGTAAPMKVPATPATSSLGPKPPALPKPNTRDYGKAAPPAAPAVNPFGPTYGGM